MATKYNVRINAAPKVGSIYWCSLHPESVIHIPEFWKKRPVVVISRKNFLRGKVIVLPITTDGDNANYANSVELSHETAAKINGQRSWVVCDHPMTVATSRLDYVSKTPPRIEPVELSVILDMAHSMIAGWMPKVTEPARNATATIMAVTEFKTESHLEEKAASVGPEDKVSDQDADID